MAQDTLKILKDSLKSGDFHNLYVFHGEEKYLLSYYLDMLREKIVSPDFAEFNLFRMEGAGLDIERLYETVEPMPAFSERKLVIVNDLDLYKPGGDRKELLDALLADIPEYTVLVFVYDTLDFKTDARSKVHKILADKALVVKFDIQGDRELSGWLRRRFSALGKTIDPPTADKMLFYCGRSMTMLITEVEKVAAYSASEGISFSDIQAVCIPVADAVVYDLTDAVAAGEHKRAIVLGRELVDMRNDPIFVLAALGRQMRQLLYARIALENRKDNDWLGEVADIRNSYAVRKTADLARRFPTVWCREAVRLCTECDYDLKHTAADRSALLETLLLRLAAMKR